MKNKKGFTLMEIMVVVLIIAGLSAIAYPTYTKAITKARIAEAFSLAEIVREAEQRSLAVNDAYFTEFSAAQTTGRTRLIKANDVSASGGNLKKGLYTVSLSKFSGEKPARCIIIKYGEDASNPIFTIYTHVEDSRIWCDEMAGGNGICETIASLETTSNDCK